MCTEQHVHVGTCSNEFELKAKYNLACLPGTNPLTMNLTKRGCIYKCSTFIHDSVDSYGKPNITKMFTTPTTSQHVIT